METSRVIWVDGDFVPWDEATVHVLAHGLHYGAGVFEGIRAYGTPTGTAVFRLTEHMERLHRSAKAYGIPLRVGVDELVKTSRQLLIDNELESAYLRPLAFYGLGSIGLNPAGAEVHVVIAAWQWGAYLGEDGLENGIRAHVSSWRRIDQGMLHPNAKGTGGYLNSILAKQEAVKNHYDEAILLNYEGFVSEGSGENIFVVKNGAVTTPPVTAGILEGITRDSVMTMLRDDGHQVREANVSRSDLYYADEVFFTGTAAEVTPVREVDDRPVGEGRPGPVTRNAQDLFQKAVTGRLEAYRHWLDYV
ncbi:MAG TPA: branched-chain amino acid transaminase [Acidimicrobiia bacterium]|nr:branched-chain amino acid transaminase [Acidimicrobiia bacterium]